VRYHLGLHVDGALVELGQDLAWRCLSVVPVQSHFLADCDCPKNFLGTGILLIYANNILHKGCRVLYHKAQPLVPLGQQCLRRIGVSFVRIVARRFISGLYMPSEVAVDVHRVIGYRIAASEQWIEVPQGISIQTIWVAFRSEGLTASGLEFADSHSQVWVGGSRGPGVARGMLKIPGNLNQSCVFAGLDSYKVVSLGIGKSRTSPEPPTGASLEGEMDPCCIESYI
jgi:hypothetical protein